MTTGEERITSIFLIPNDVSPIQSVSSENLLEVTNIQPAALQDVNVATNNKYSFFIVNPDETIEAFRFYHKSTVGMRLPPGRSRTIGIFDDYMYIGKLSLGKMQSQNIKILVSKEDSIFEKLKQVKKITDTIFEGGQQLNVYIQTSAGVVQQIETIDVPKSGPMTDLFVRNQVTSKLEKSESGVSINPDTNVYVTFRIPKSYTSSTFESGALTSDKNVDIDVIAPAPAPAAPAQLNSARQSSSP
jgi:hypothetical protein